MKGVNWVKDRSNCNLDLAFLAILDCVKRDVEEASKLSDKVRDSYTFSIDHSDQGARERIQVKGKTPDNMVRQELDKFEISVIFEKRESSINVFLNGNEIFNVVAEWDPKSSSCQYKVGKEILEPWEISRKALENLFFRRG